MGLNATEMRLSLTGPGIRQADEYLAKGHQWTGGFTNRFAYRDYFAGLDILYQLGQRPYSLEHWLATDPNYAAPSNNNSFSLQNLYIGARLKVDNWKYAEVYISTRNILQNNSSKITDERRLYGIGCKVNF
jgi:hypothetical protein